MKKSSSKNKKSKKTKPKTPAKKKVSASATPDGLLTRRELAAALSVGRPEPLHMQTVTKWEQENMPVAVRGGKGRPSFYDEAEVRAWIEERAEKAKAAAAPGGFNPFQAKAEKEYWQGRLARQQHELRSGELVRTIDVEKMWTAEVTAVRAIILAAYVTHADRVCRAAKLDGLLGVEREMKMLGEEVCRELAREDRPVAELAIPEDGDPFEPGELEESAEA
jgi:predicted DNA-binding transcriptional regulator AlpA